MLQWRRWKPEKYSFIDPYVQILAVGVEALRNGPGWNREDGGKGKTGGTGHGNVFPTRQARRSGAATGVVGTPAGHCPARQAHRPEAPRAWWGRWPGHCPARQAHRLEGATGGGDAGQVIVRHTGSLPGGATGVVGTPEISGHASRCAGIRLFRGGSGPFWEF